MINAKTLVAVHTHTHTHTHTICLNEGLFASIFTPKNNLIEDYINRANLVMCFNCGCNFNT